MRFPWQRNKTDESALPQEVQDYYQAEKRQRAGVAGLLAIGTLLLTVALAAIIFFGGRWIWRHGFHHNSPKGQTTASVQAPDDQASSSTSQPSQPKSDTSTSTPSTTSNSSSNSVATGSNSAASNNAGTMPNTGPGNILPVIIGAVALGFILAEGYQRRALKR